MGTLATVTGGGTLTSAPAGMNDVFQHRVLCLTGFAMQSTARRQKSCGQRVVPDVRSKPAWCPVWILTQYAFFEIQMYPFIVLQLGDAVIGLVKRYQRRQGLTIQEEPESAHGLNTAIFFCVRT